MGLRAVAGRGGPPAGRGAGRHPQRLHLQARDRRARRRIGGPRRPVSAGEAFDNAREPLAQAFKAVGTSDRGRVRGDRQPLQVEGLAAPPATPTARATPTTGRVIQANALVDVRQLLRGRLRSVSRVFLTGDFNAYSKEDPIQVLRRGRLHQPRVDRSTRTRRATTSTARSARSTTCSRTRRLWPTVDGRRHLGDQRQRDGATTSTAASTTTAPTSTTTDPFRASDHNPELVGIDVRGAGRDDRDPDPWRRTTSTVGSPTTRRLRRPVPACWPVR